MNSNAAGMPHSRAPSSDTVGIASSPWVQACTSIPSAADERNSLQCWTTDLPTECVCPAGDGPLSKKVPEVIPALLSIVGPQTGGDPMGETKFVRRSLQT